MENPAKVLIFSPVILAVLFIAVYMINNNPLRSHSNSVSFISGSAKSPSEGTCVDCPSNANIEYCTDPNHPVLGGVDFVDYFTTFKMADGSYDETKRGMKGSARISSIYNTNTFYFRTQEHKALFDASPTSYIPQYGGFCSWGISAESCPEYPWSSTCLGPSGNWGHWTIQHDKLYFFLFQEPREKFLEDVDSLIASGNERWRSWFGDTNQNSHLSTTCFVAEGV